MKSDVYTLMLIFEDSYTNEEGEVVTCPTFLPFSYSSEDQALHNAEMAEAVYEDIVSWGVTRCEMDVQIGAHPIH